MTREKQIDLMVTTDIQAQTNVSSWIDHPEVKQALRDNAAKMREFKFRNKTRTNSVS